MKAVVSLITVGGGPMIQVRWNGGITDFTWMDIEQARALMHDIRAAVQGAQRAEFPPTGDGDGE